MRGGWRKEGRCERYRGPRTYEGYRVERRPFGGCPKLFCSPIVRGLWLARIRSVTRIFLQRRADNISRDDKLDATIQLPPARGVV
jgi:hypothetical protein